MATAQTGTLNGKVLIANNNEALPYASVQLQGTALGATCDSAGNYTIANIPAGTYNIIGSFAGFK
jgi:CarboxypepD_reg-like domain